MKNMWKKKRPRNLKEVPYIRLEQAARRFAAGNPPDGKALIDSALHHSSHAAAPVGIHSQAADMLLKYNLDRDALRVVQNALDLYPGDKYLRVQKSRILLIGGNIAAAARAAEDVFKDYPGDALALSAFANTLMASGRAKDAVKLLEPHVKKDGTDKVSVIGALSSAYVLTQNRRRFESLLVYIRPNARVEFNKACLSFIEADTNRAERLLKPLLMAPRPFATNVGLYLACVNDENPVAAAVRDALAPAMLERALALREEWRANPIRAAMLSQPFFYASSQALFELGANPASVLERSKAGLGKEAPVTSRSFTNNHKPKF
jgi:tetratricopeptide (TPR) repeat protein